MKKIDFGHRYALKVKRGLNPAYVFEFTVGETYENEKGLFSVISIEKEDMVIRWKTGEEIETSIEFQGRIQKRRQWEKALQQESPAVAKPAPKKTKASKSNQNTPSTEQENRPD
jgi:hypothetical protein